MRRCAAAALLALAGCGGSGEPARRTDSVVDPGGGQAVVVSGPSGRTVVRTGNVAATLPAGLALFPGATVSSSTAMQGSGAGRSGTVLSFDSAAPPAAILAFYKAAAVRAGYALDAELATGAMTMLSAHKRDSHFNLTVTRAADRSSATLIAG